MANRIVLRLRSLLANRSGNALIEFAVAFPVLLLLYTGTYVLSDAISCNRKVTVTARALTDLATRYPSLTQAEAATILNASAQVLSPYSSDNAVIALSQIKVTDATHATVIWSKGLNRGAATNGLTASSTVTIPANMAATDTYLILGQVQYTYTPNIRFMNISNFVLSDSIIMVPRVSDQVPLT